MKNKSLLAIITLTLIITSCGVSKSFNKRKYLNLKLELSQKAIETETSEPYVKQQVEIALHDSNEEEDTNEPIELEGSETATIRTIEALETTYSTVKNDKLKESSFRSVRNEANLLSPRPKSQILRDFLNSGELPNYKTLIKKEPGNLGRNFAIILGISVIVLGSLLGILLYSAAQGDDGAFGILNFFMEIFAIGIIIASGIIGIVIILLAATS